MENNEVVADLDLDMVDIKVPRSIADRLLALAPALHAQKVHARQVGCNVHSSRGIVDPCIHLRANVARHAGFDRDDDVRELSASDLRRLQRHRRSPQQVAIDLVKQDDAARFDLYDYDVPDEDCNQDIPDDRSAVSVLPLDDATHLDADMVESLLIQLARFRDIAAMCDLMCRDLPTPLQKELVANSWFEPDLWDEDTDESVHSHVFELHLDHVLDPLEEIMESMLTENQKQKEEAMMPHDAA